MASSDSFVIYIRSSRDFNFAVAASSDDDISSLKKKAEAHHLALFPHNGRIVSQAIKMWHEGIVYYLSDDIPVRCLFDVDGANKGKHLLYMDAVTVPPDSAETRTHVLSQNSDPSRGRDRDCSLNQNQEGNTNTNCTSDTPKRKDPVVEEMTTGVGVLGEGNNSSKEKNSKKVDPDPFSFSSDDDDDDDEVQEMTTGVGVLGEGNNSSKEKKSKEVDPDPCSSSSSSSSDEVEEMTTGVGVLGEGNNSSKKKKSKEVDPDPSSDDDDDEAPPSSASVEESESGSESPKTGGDRMQERSASAAPENENEIAGIHLVTWNPEAASADVVVLDAATPGGNANGSNYSKKENSMAWVKEARKEVGCNTRSTTNADVSGETSSLAPSGSDLRDKGTVTPDNQIKDNNASLCTPPDADIAIEVDLGKTKQASQPIPKTTDKEKMNKSQNNSISATDSIVVSASDKKKRRTREKVVPSSPPTIERENENEISREDASKKKKRKQQDATQEVDLCQNGDPSSGRDRDRSLNQNQGGNTNYTSEALKRRKSLGDNTNFAILLAPKANESCKEKENNMALEKEARKEVGFTRLTTNAGETSSLSPSGRVKAKQASQPIPKTDKEKMKKSQNNSISATDKKRRPKKPKKNKIEINVSQVAVMVPDELRCCRNSGSGWRCYEKAMPNSKYCTRHCSKSTSSKKHVVLSTS